MTNFLRTLFMFLVRIGIFLVVVFGLCFFALLLFINMHDWSTDIAKYSKQAIGRPIVVSGGVRPGFHFNDITLVVYDVGIPAEKEGDIPIHAQSVVISLKDIYAIIKHNDKSLLEKLSLAGSLEGLSIGSEKIGDIKLSFHKQDNGFSLKPLTFKRGKTAFNGEMLYENTHLRLDGQLTKFDYGRYLDDLEGTLNADIHLKSHGDTPDKLLYNLGGKVNIIADKGKIAGHVIDLWAADILTSLFLPSKSEDTELKCGVGVFDITNGIADSQFVLDTDRVLISGKGFIDLIKGQLKLEVYPKPKKSSLISMATPVHVKGDWANPSVSPFKSSILTKIGGIALSAINPAALAFSFTKVGSFEKHPCMKLLQEDKEAKDQKNRKTEDKKK